MKNAKDKKDIKSNFVIKLVKWAVTVVIAPVIVGLAVYSIINKNATARLKAFKMEVITIENKNMSAGDKCECLKKAAIKLQDDDKKLADDSQLGVLKIVEECNEKLMVSDKHWDQVNSSYIAFITDKTLNSANTFMTMMYHLDDFDKYRSSKRKDVFDAKLNNIKEDINKRNEILKSLETSIRRFHQNGPCQNTINPIATLIDTYNNLLIHCKPGELTIAEGNIIGEALKIKESNYIKQGHPLEKEQTKEIKSSSEMIDGQHPLIYIDTSSITDRYLEALPDLLNKQFKNIGFNPTPFPDDNIPKIKIYAPDDGKVIINFPIDSEGRLKFAVSVKVKLIIASKKVEKDIGPITLSGLGASESEALQAAQQKIAMDISNKIINSLKILKTY